MLKKYKIIFIFEPIQATNTAKTVLYSAYCGDTYTEINNRTQNI